MKKLFELRVILLDKVYDLIMNVLDAVYQSRQKAWRKWEGLERG